MTYVQSGKYHSYIYYHPMLEGVHKMAQISTVDNSITHISNILALFKGSSIINPVEATQVYEEDANRSKPVAISYIWHFCFNKLRFALVKYSSTFIARYILDN